MRLRVWAALASMAVGYGFSYVVARNDHSFQILIAGLTSIGIFLVLSGFIAQYVSDEADSRPERARASTLRPPAPSQPPTDPPAPK